MSLVLSVGVVGFLSLVNTIFGQTAGDTGQGARAILIAAPVALIAVFLGLRLASRMGLDKPGPAAALNKAAIVSLLFTALLTPAMLLMPAAGTALAGGALGPALVSAASCSTVWRAHCSARSLRCHCCSWP